jgi:hypothetical protein
MTQYTTRQSRKNLSTVNATVKALRGIQEGFVRGDKAGTIRLINGVRPIVVIEYLLGRKITQSEGTQYLLAIDYIPVDIRGAFKLGKEFQDIKQTARKQLQGGDVTDLTHRFKKFMDGLEVERVRLA